MKKHIPYILVVLLLTLAYMHPFLSTKIVLHRNDLPSQDIYYYKIIKDAIFKYHTLPLWQYNFQGGSPFISNAEVPFLDPTYIFIILFQPLAAVNFSLIFFMFLAGVGMYCLIYNIYHDQKAAILSSVIYMFNGWIFHFMGNPPTMKGYSYFPFLFMFIYLAINKKNWLKYSVFAILFASLQLFSGSPWIFIYSNIFIFFYVCYSITTKEERFKTIKISLIYLILTLGLSAIVILPAWETTQSTFRSRPLSFEEFVGEDYLRLNDANSFLIKNGESPGYTAAIGLISILFLLYSLKFWKRRLVLFCWIVILVSVLYSTGLLARLVYYIPVINSLRHVSRGIFWFIISTSILVPYSFIKITPKFKNVKYAFIIIFILLIIEIGAVGYFTPAKERYYFNLEQNQLVRYLADQKGMFRVDSIVPTAPMVRASLIQKGIFYDLQTVSPESAFIRDEYLIFHYMALQTNLPKLWGVLNVKYISSDIRFNSTDLELIKQFDVCNDCDVEWNPWIVGPYLYENKYFLPRAYILKNAIHISGEREKQIQLIGYLFNLEKFDPKRTALISDSQTVGSERFVGTISTDKKITQNEIDSWLSEEGSFEEVEISTYSPNKVKIKLENKTGFLVLSETFSIFPGWTAKLNGKKQDILRANYIGTAVFLENASGELEFKYFPMTLKIGLIVSIFSLSALILILCSDGKHDKNKKEKKDY